MRSLDDLNTFSSMVLQQRVVGSSTEHQASSRSHAIIRMEVENYTARIIIIYDCTIQVMDDEVCSALEAAEEARALLPALLSAFDNHQVQWVETIMMRQG